MPIDDYLNQSGYRVTKANHVLYDALSAATLALTGSLPAVAFRCLVAVYTAGAHTDCAGSVVVGSETLTFTAAAKKVTTVNLSALPVITTSGLNCMVLVEANTTGGAPIQEETQTAIDCRFQNTQKSFQNSAGEWTKSQAIAYVSDSNIAIGSIFSQGGYDYSISQVSAHDDLDGDEVFRKLYLTGRTVAPATRAAAAEAPGTVVPSDVMLKSVYDIDNDLVADQAEGIREVTEFPTSPKKGDMVLKDGEIYVCTGT
jgi:hypothetical protein